MAGLCEGGNEPTGSLKASKHITPARHILGYSPIALISLATDEEEMDLRIDIQMGSQAASKNFINAGKILIDSII
ncbi:hypothetical protein ANN_27126 [Periplaneta americana]|uniref:Uncharacterized protein n=1 Tax=Periplaneta americana TaxID=6978 RepID=A0ABQ8RX57_PERAM|nr:hypothetical protein ANN_27126 [Periplaneta americana]